MAFRTIAYNVLQCTGYPEGAPPALGAPETFAQALGGYAPDIVTFAESPPEAVVATIAREMGMSHVFFPSTGRWPGALLTRFGIEAVEARRRGNDSRFPDEFTRHWGRVMLVTDGGERLVVHSIHLHPSDASIRGREVLAVLEAVRGEPADVHVVVQGDFNHRPDMPEYEWWGNAGLFDTFEPDAGDGHTYRADLPMARLDYIWVGRTLASRVVRGRALAEPPFVPSAAVPWALSDHVPQIAVIEPAIA
jgi:endonuclease/exonuclease/phosphatase family metal-dependent hydrolase